MAKTKVNEWLEQDKLILLEAWARDGLTDEQIANNMGISIASFYNYKNKYKEILEALKKGKEVADIEVENALFKRAVGYTTKIMEQKVDRFGEVHDLIREIHFPPDTTAQIYWLKNRKPDKWRDKVVDTENEEAIANANEILVKIRKTVNDRYERD